MTTISRSDGPAAALRAEARALRNAADRLDAMAAAIEGGEALASPEDRLLDMSQAARLMGRSSSWLYANARKYGFGWKVPSGSWTFSERALRAFKGGLEAPVCEVCEAHAKFAKHQGFTTTATVPIIGKDHGD